MGKYFGAVVTANGQKMLAEAIAEKRVITFTALKTSTNTIPSGTTPATLTTLPNIRVVVLCLFILHRHMILVQPKTPPKFSIYHVRAIYIRDSITPRPIS